MTHIVIKEVAEERRKAERREVDVIKATELYSAARKEGRIILCEALLTSIARNDLTKGQIVALIQNNLTAMLDGEL